jgi:hypothetical protein
MSAAWKEVWGADAARVVVVAQGQTVWPITSSKVLSCRWGPSLHRRRLRCRELRPAPLAAAPAWACSLAPDRPARCAPARPRRNATAHIDALAIGPYFGAFNASRDTSADAVLETGLPQDLATTTAWVAQHAAIARQFNKPLITYEAGQGMAGDSAALITVRGRHRAGGAGVCCSSAWQQPMPVRPGALAPWRPALPPSSRCHLSATATSRARPHAPARTRTPARRPTRTRAWGRCTPPTWRRWRRTTCRWWCTTRQ